MRTIVIPGGSGFLGRHVAKRLSERGWNVVVLSRDPTAQVEGATTIAWDGRSLGPWTNVLDDADVVLNLAGRSVNCRYHEKNRREIEESRVHSTRVLGEALAAAKRKHRVWLNSSTATIYRHADDRPQNEFTGEIGSGFSVNVALAWEKAFFDAAVPDIRKVATRSAMVMGPGRGGPFSVFCMLVKLCLGGRMGSGQQYVSWIHIDDFCRAIEFLIGREDLSGIFNVASPNPIQNHQFMRELRRAAGVRIGLPATKWMLEIGAFFLRTETELPLKSRFVVPKRLTDAGLELLHPTWDEAALDLLQHRVTTTPESLPCASPFLHRV